MPENATLALLISPVVNAVLVGAAILAVLALPVLAEFAATLLPAAAIAGALATPAVAAGLAPRLTGRK